MDTEATPRQDEDEDCSVEGLVLAVVEKAIPRGDDDMVRLADELEDGIRIVSIDNLLYICVDLVVGWQPISSNTAMSFICRRLDLRVPVNYEIATAPMRDYLSYREWSIIVFPHSVCFDKRYKLEVDEQHGEKILRLTALRTSITELLEQSSESREIDDTIALKRIKLSHVPTQIPLKKHIDSAIQDFFSGLMGESFYTFMWLIGNCIVDPILQSYVVVLWGPSGGGKSALLTIISNIFATAATSVFSNIFAIIYHLGKQ